ncbi:hypothetical protein ASPVEDRAFT_718369 [Aspergillus versicolor CBS 583.65]|uniref:Uncharacterized protein n=1 Tax=Aspergillus versicolor CBS 583.65 TaxID=1036611 RepID=A0A1L9PNT6_ASPVE|nr:uncharacterized protein ASPVEDRAFT_718369 [Aspergillus versicolor CBS 583.65]OJJ03207.1 hypothetical protein ASPVEDRAFT_718369 [Aspergillus versicolor CBS 583.65]
MLTRSWPGSFRRDFRVTPVQQTADHAIQIRTVPGDTLHLFQLLPARVTLGGSLLHNNPQSFWYLGIHRGHSFSVSDKLGPESLKTFNPIRALILDLTLQLRMTWIIFLDLLLLIHCGKWWWLVIDLRAAAVFDNITTECVGLIKISWIPLLKVSVAQCTF